MTKQNIEDWKSENQKIRKLKKWKNNKIEKWKIKNQKKQTISKWTNNRKRNR